MRPHGFDGRGLQFALHYAFFLKRNGQGEDALDILAEPIRALDMDRNPNQPVHSDPQPDDAERYPLRRPASASGRYLYWRASAGVSRKEYLRLAYGVFKQAGREEFLTGLLEKEIAGGENRLRRVLSRVRLHQGRSDDALALELAYLDQAALGELSTSFRRGQAYEDYGKLREAVAAYERALAMDYSPPKLSDPDEEATQSRLMRQAVVMPPSAASSAGRASFQTNILARIARIYGALGEPEKAYATSLRQFELNATMLQDFRALQQLASRSEALGRQASFRQWLAARSETTDIIARANVFWLLEDYAACAQALGEQSARPGRAFYAYETWRERFRKIGKPQLRRFLQKLLERDPQNARVRLDLLDLDDDFEGPQAIAALEALLETDAQFAFARGKGSRNRTRFRNYYDLAYRLMRLYEKA